jgi:protein-disulfide isomerase
VIVFLSLAGAALLVGIIGLATREPDAEYVDVAGVSDAQRIFGGVRQLGDRLGDEDAAVQIQYFTDVQSAGFRDQFLEVIPTLVNTRVRSGEVKLLLRNRSLTRNATELSFYGVEAAAEQNYGWNYGYLMIRNQELARAKGLDREFLVELAKSVEGLELVEWKAAYDAGLDPGSEMNRSLEEQDTLAINLDIRAAPAMVIAGPGGTEVLQDSPDLATVQQAIDSVR